MNTVYILQKTLLSVIENHRNVDRTNAPPLDWERVHMISCAKVGYLLALARDVDPIIAACACSVHDFGRILTGNQENHGPNGAILVREFLFDLNLFTQDEIDMIAMAVNNHSKKGEVGNPLEELVKDADLIDYASYGQVFKRQEQIDRFNRLADLSFR